MKNLLQREKLAVALLFLLLTLVGLWTAGDYTGSYDELAEQGILAGNMKEYALWLERVGIRSEYWLHSGYVPISESVEKDHGICGFYLYGLLMPWLESNEALRFWTWNAMNWLWFMLGVWSLYALARQMGFSRFTACMAALLMYVSPRFFADAHVNNKDMPLLSMMLATLWLGARFVDQPSIRRGLALSCMGAVAMNTKIVALMAWGVCWAGAAVRMVARREWNRSKTLALLLSAVSFVGFYALLTPAVWSGPVAFLRYLVTNAAAFSRWEGRLFFRGASFQLPENPLPAYYLPYMMLVTLPLYTLPLCAVGQMAVIRKVCKERLTFLKETGGIMLAAATLCWLAPTTGFMLIRPLVYNGWRHFYFTFAGVAPLMACGIETIWQACRNTRRRRAICAGALCFCAAVTAMGMVYYHPHQSSYYNVLAGNCLMETDYWNTGGTDALKRLLACEERDESLPLEVGCWFFDIQNARWKLSDGEKAVLTTTTAADAPYLYYIENYAQIYEAPPPEGYHVLFEIESYGRRIGTMYEQNR